jgi:hypothetical protein
MSTYAHSGTVLESTEATSPGRKPDACSAKAMSFARASHSFQLTVCQMPRCFSRSAGFSPRVATESRKLFGTVSATVSVAGFTIISPSKASFRGAAKRRTRNL